MSWIQTRSGAVVDLIDPKPATIVLDDIAHALAHLCRYTGHTERHYSVAEHSILIADYLASDGHEPQTVLGALLHDAHEAYLGDISAPLKAAIRVAAPDAHVGLGALTLRMDVAIGAALGADPAWWRNRIVKIADTRILLDERDAMLGPPPAPWWPETQGMKPLGVVVEGWPASVARLRWTLRVRELLATVTR